MPTEQERREFRLYCEVLTDAQLVNVVAKERGAAEYDPAREVYAGIAETVAESRVQCFARLCTIIEP